MGNCTRSAAISASASAGSNVDCMTMQPPHDSVPPITIEKGPDQKKPFADQVRTPSCRPKM